MKAGFDRALTGQLERSRENPTVDPLEKLADALGVPLRDFFIEPAPDRPVPANLKRGRR